MRELSINETEGTLGGGFCNAVPIADAVVVAGGVAGYLGWITITPVGAGLLVGAGVVFAGASLYCAYR